MTAMMIIQMKDVNSMLRAQSIKSYAKNRTWTRPTSHVRLMDSRGCPVSRSPSVGTEHLVTSRITLPSSKVGTKKHGKQKWSLSDTQCVSVVSGTKCQHNKKSKNCNGSTGGGYASLDGTILLLPVVMDVFSLVST